MHAAQTLSADAVIDIRGLTFRWQPQAPVVLALDALRIEKGERRDDVVAET